MTGFGRVGQASCLSPSSEKVSDRLEACPHVICLPARRRAAGFSVPGQGPDRRLSADGGDADDAKSVRRLSGRIRRIQNLFPRPQLHRPINSARRRRWRAWKFCKANHPFAPRQNLEKNLHEELQSLWSLPDVGDIRQVGLIAGIELVRTGGRASRLICGNARAFVFARQWPGAACSHGPSATSSC